MRVLVTGGAGFIGSHLCDSSSCRLRGGLLTLRTGLGHIATSRRAIPVRQARLTNSRSRRAVTTCCTCEPLLPIDYAELSTRRPVAPSPQGVARPRAGAKFSSPRRRSLRRPSCTRTRGYWAMSTPSAQGVYARPTLSEA